MDSASVIIIFDNGPAVHWISGLQSSLPFALFPKTTLIILVFTLLLILENQCFYCIYLARI